MFVCTITTVPEIESESPFIIASDGKNEGGTHNLKFIGDYARARRKELLSLRPGDVASIGGLIRDDAILVQTFTIIATSKPITGRNMDYYA